MERHGVRNDVIYELKEPQGSGGAYVYVRAWEGNDLMFSILDEPEKTPNFDNCGMFWIKPENFLKIFKVSEHPRQ